MPKPLIAMWTDNDVSNLRSYETRLNNMNTGSQPILRFEAYRSRGGRGASDPGTNPGFIVGSPQNPSGNFPNANAIVKADEVELIDEGRLLSMECNSTQTGFQPGTQFRFNIPVPWRDFPTGAWDQVWIDKFGEARFRHVVEAGVYGHVFEVIRSEVNIHQGIGEAQPGSASSDVELTPVSNRGNSVKYREFQAAARYFINFAEGKIVGASGLVNPYPIPEGMFRWSMTLGSKQFVQGGQQVKYAENWADGLQDVIDILGSDGYCGASETDTYSQIHDPAFQVAKSLGFKFGVFETGVHNDAIRDQWIRDAFTYLSTKKRSEFYFALFTSISDLRFDTTPSYFRSFHDGWQAFLAAPDPGGDDDPPPPPPPPPPTDFVPGVVSPQVRVKMYG